MSAAHFPAEMIVPAHLAGWSPAEAASVSGIFESRLSSFYSMKNQEDDFHRCFSLQGSTTVVCEHENGTYVLGDTEEGAPTKKNRLELLK